MEVQSVKKEEKLVNNILFIYIVGGRNFGFCFCHAVLEWRHTGVYFPAVGTKRYFDKAF